MKKVVIAFDIDGTLRKNSEERHRTEVEPNNRIVTLLFALSHCKNTEIHLWSNRGAEYCKDMRQTLGLSDHVKEAHCHLKTWDKNKGSDGRPIFWPDIAIDDQQRFDGGILNLIVREK